MTSCSDKICAPMKFNEMKLSKFIEGDTFDVIGIKPMTTKFGKTYILLLSNDDRVFANKTITNYINDCWDIQDWQLQFDINEGDPLFSFTIGAAAEYNGHQYNKIIMN